MYARRSPTSRRSSTSGSGWSSTRSSSTRVDHHGLPAASPPTTRIAADCRPRMSPPSASAASSAASIRSARSPLVDAYAASIASGTVSRSIMFACTDTLSPVRCPAWAMQRAPVCAATFPRASIIATCRTASRSSPATSARSASGAVLPPRISSSPSGPYDVSLNACVATAPTPASAHGTTDPTEK